MPDTLSAVLSQDPDWLRLPVSMPASIRRLLQRLLRKDANLRMQHIGDTRIELLEVSIDTAPTESPRRPWTLVAAIAAAVITGVILRGLFVPTRVTTPFPPTVRMRVTLPDGHKLLSQRGRAEVFGEYSPLAISRDGRQIAFAARDASGTARLYLRAIDSLELRPQPGTEHGELPFFSPDGRWLGFLVGNRVLKVPVKGGVPIVIGKTPWETARGVAWASERTLVLGGVNTGAFRMDAETGDTQPLTELDNERQENYHAWPFVLPDDEHVLFTVVTPIRTDLAVLNLQTGEWRLLDQTEGAAQPHYVASGHVVFFRRGGLFAAPFDLSRLAISGTITNVPLGDLVQGWNAGLDYGFFAASASGSLVYVPGTADLQESRVVRVDRHGNAEPLSEVGRFAYMPSLSPDGARLVVTDSLPSEETDVDLFLLDTSRGSRARITPDGASLYPVWSADGQRIFFCRYGEGGDSDVYSMAADGSGVMEALADIPYDQQPTDASPDGRLVAFDENNPDTGYDVRIISLDDNRSIRAFAATSASERDASFSRDGRFVAYVSNESGRNEVYVRQLSGDGGKTIVSTAGGRWPRWSRSGDELFYMQDTVMMSVRVQFEPSFRPGTPEPLFEGNYVHQFDVFPDGEHFVMVTFPDVALREIEVVANWSTELAEIMPTDQ